MERPRFRAAAQIALGFRPLAANRKKESPSKGEALLWGLGCRTLFLRDQSDNV